MRPTRRAGDVPTSGRSLLFVESADDLEFDSASDAFRLEMAPDGCDAPSLAALCP